MKVINRVFSKKPSHEIGDDIFDKRYDWNEIKSKHFIYKYVSENGIPDKLSVLDQMFKDSYAEISNYLNIDIDHVFKIYFTPDLNFCKKHDVLISAAVPILNWPA